MIKSMTGFGKAVNESNIYELQIEIKSVNNRYLDLNFRMPSILQQFEMKLRTEIKKKLTRGSIGIFFSLNKKKIIENDEFDDPKLNFSIEKLTDIYSKLIETSRIIGLNSDSITWDLILNNFNIVDNFNNSNSEDELDEEELFNFINNTLTKSLDNLIDFRVKEGKALYDDVKQKITDLNQIVKNVKELSKDAAKVQFAKLKERLDKYTDLKKFDQTRLEQELVIISDKVDIDEEITRLFSHIELFNNTIDNKENLPAGQKLNFITQEMHREVNTISSKTNLTDITNFSVDMKEIIEKVREQVQNIE